MPDALFEVSLMGSGVFEKEKQEEGKAVAELRKGKTLDFQIVQYSCLENPMGGGASQATVQGVARCWTQLNDFTSQSNQSEILV